MTITRFDQNKLLVEGKEEVFLISELAEKRLGIDWGNPVRKEPPVDIHDCGGVAKLLDSVSLSTHLKTPNLKALGLIVDANSDLSARWNQLRNRFLPAFPTIPADPDPAGMIVENESGIRLGFWLMTDNKSPGMIEDAVRDLGIDPKQSWVVGDKWLDVQLGHAAGTKSILVRTGWGAQQEQDRPADQHVDAVCDNLIHAVSVILGGTP